MKKTAILEEGPVDGHVDMEPAMEDVPREVFEEWGLLELVDPKTRQVSIFECLDPLLAPSRVVDSTALCEEKDQQRGEVDHPPTSVEDATCCSSSTISRVTPRGGWR